MIFVLVCMYIPVVVALIAHVLLHVSERMVLWNQLPASQPFDHTENCKLIVQSQKWESMHWNFFALGLWEIPWVSDQPIKPARQSSQGQRSQRTFLAWLILHQALQARVQEEQHDLAIPSFASQLWKAISHVKHATGDVALRVPQDSKAQTKLFHWTCSSQPNNIYI
jgi:hypothetical protein